MMEIIQKDILSRPTLPLASSVSLPILHLTQLANWVPNEQPEGAGS